MKYMVVLISPKKSAKTLQLASDMALATGAEVVVLKVVPNPQKVGVVAELIATDRPATKAEQQRHEAVATLQGRSIRASSLVRVDDVAAGIVKAAEDENADLCFIMARICSASFRAVVAVHGDACFPMV